jgi:2-haloacid dehalogenase
VISVVSVIMHLLVGAILAGTRAQVLCPAGPAAQSRAVVAAIRRRKCRGDRRERRGPRGGKRPPPATSCGGPPAIRRFLLLRAASAAATSGGGALRSWDAGRPPAPAWEPYAMTFRPKYVTFDCYGTLINFDMAGAARRVYGAQLSEPAMAAFIKDFSAYRLDEVLGAWKPYAEVVHNAVERTCKRNGVAFRPEDAQTIYEEVPTWGPHPDVPAGLARVAKDIPLVILSNAMNSQIGSNVEKLGAPFHAVFTAEQAGSYKPRMKGFEYMFDQLGCGPEDITHVSSSFRYDLMTAYDLGIRSKVWVNRGHEPANPYYEYTEIEDIGGLAAAVGLEDARQPA